MESKEIKKLALEAGLCEKWANKWKKNWSVDQMLEALSSLDGMEFFAKKDFPSIAFILQNSEGKHEQHGIILKRLHDKLLVRGQLKYLFADSQCNVVAPYGWTGFIYVTKGSKINLYLPLRHGATVRFDATSSVKVMSGVLRDKQQLNDVKDGI